MTADLGMFKVRWRLDLSGKEMPDAGISEYWVVLAHSAAEAITLAKAAQLETVKQEGLDLIERTMPGKTSWEAESVANNVLSLGTS